MLRKQVFDEQDAAQQGEREQNESCADELEHQRFGECQRRKGGGESADPARAQCVFLDREKNRQQRGHAQHAIAEQREHDVQFDLPFDRQRHGRRREDIDEQENRGDREDEDAERGDRPREIDEQAHRRHARADQRQRGEKVQVDAAAMDADQDREMHDHRDASRSTIPAFACAVPRNSGHASTMAAAM